MPATECADCGATERDAICPWCGWNRAAVAWFRAHPLIPANA